VPASLATRRQLAAADLRLPHDAQPTAYGPGGVKLFTHGQCKAYSPTARTEALWQLEDLFYRYADKNSYIRDRISVRSPADAPWVTIQTDPDLRHAPRLTSKLFQQHFLYSARIGVMAKTDAAYTRWLDIDIDLHNRDPFVFYAQCEILLAELCSAGGKWLFECSASDPLRGLNLIELYPGARKLKYAIADKQTPRISYSRALPRDRGVGGLFVSMNRPHPIVVSFFKGSGWPHFGRPFQNPQFMRRP
jgi:hypothetical protein